MKSILTQVEFYFPEKASEVKNKEELADLIVDAMRASCSVEYSGHLDEKGLREGLLRHVGNGDITQYSTLSASQKIAIRRQIEKTVQTCHVYLPVPTKNFVFIFPYLPTKKDTVFNGVMGVARYSCVFHIFLSPDLWSPNALTNTVAHELNHTIFYYHHFNHFNNYTLLDEIIIEGLAENFKEQIGDKTPAPWAIALSRKKAFNALASVDQLLSSRDSRLHQNVLFGNKKYARWTGYSIGYWLIKELIQKKQDYSWEKIMKLSSKEILEIARE